MQVWARGTQKGPWALKIQIWRGKLTEKKIFGSIRIDSSFGAMVLRGSGPQVSRTPISRFPENRFPDGTGARIEFTGKFLAGSIRLDPKYRKIVVKPQNTFCFISFWWILGFGGSVPRGLHPALGTSMPIWTTPDIPLRRPICDQV